MHTLLPKLETGESCKLCFHHRDFTVGVAVTDNIINSIHNSYHTVLIVSNDFLKSDWCMLEFRIALHRSLQDKNRHLIFVIFHTYVFLCRKEIAYFSLSQNSRSPILRYVWVEIQFLKSGSRLSKRRLSLITNIKILNYSLYLLSEPHLWCKRL
jgi:hypothetical protein